MCQIFFQPTLFPHIVRTKLIVEVEGNGRNSSISPQNYDQTSSLPCRTTTKPLPFPPRTTTKLLPFPSRTTTKEYKVLNSRAYFF